MFHGKRELFELMETWPKSRNLLEQKITAGEIPDV